MQPRLQILSSSVGLLILRLGVGGYMLSHGWGKLQMMLSGDFEKFGDPIGLGSGLSLVLVTLAEFLCALLVMFGLATRLATLPVVIAMAVAAFVAHGGDPWSSEQAAMLFMAGEAKSWASKEPALMFLAVFLALMFTGAGMFSFDAFIHPRLRRVFFGRKPEAK
jgi:putative oxidoreductase